jgi:hypothetical protein
MDPAMAQPYNDHGSFDHNFLDYVLEVLKEQPNNAFNHVRSLVAATEATMTFSAVEPMGWSAIARSRQRVIRSDRNFNSSDITSITNKTSIENMGLVDGIVIVEGAMSLGG